MRQLLIAASALCIYLRNLWVKKSLKTFIHRWPQMTAENTRSLFKARLDSIFEFICVICGNKFFTLIISLHLMVPCRFFL
jgi:hypothetical protein